MAQAKLDQEKSAQSFMDTMLEGKKMSKAEAETRSIVSTDNDYDLYNNQHEDVVELVNSCKKRLDVLSWERKG